jgi:hypothetical protein
MLENATDTYNGETGCACGCGGTYAGVESVAGQKRIKKIMNADLAKLANFDFVDATAWANKKLDDELFVPPFNAGCV